MIKESYHITVCNIRSMVLLRAEIHLLIEGFKVENGNPFKEQILCWGLQENLYYFSIPLVVRGPQQCPWTTRQLQFCFESLQWQSGMRGSRLGSGARAPGARDAGTRTRRTCVARALRSRAQRAPSAIRAPNSTHCCRTSASVHTLHISDITEIVYFDNKSIM